MIEWIKYDPKNPPKLYEEHLVWYWNGAKVAELQSSAYGERLEWIELQECLPVTDVTHYAIITLPDTMKLNTIYALNDIGITELTPEEAKESLEGTQLPKGMSKIIEGEKE